jgi:hypothetical protein
LQPLQEESKKLEEAKVRNMLKKNYNDYIKLKSQYHPHLPPKKLVEEESKEEAKNP